VGSFVSIAFNTAGQLTVAYDANAGTGRFLRFATFNGTTWSIETVAPGGYGISLAYGPDGSPTISHVTADYKLYFVKKSGSTWTSTRIENRDVQQLQASLAYDPSGHPAISYWKEGRSSPGLYIARYNGTSWTTQPVEAGAKASFNPLAFDPAGNAYIAYGDNIDDNDSWDTVKVARSNGSGWEVTILENSYGVFGDLAIDPTTGHPAVVTRGASPQPRYFYWNGATWVGPELVEISQGIRNPALAFDQSGTPHHLACLTSGGVRFAHRDAFGTWSYEIVDSEDPGGVSRISLKFGPDGLPVTGYGFRLSPYLGSLRIAIKTSP
jgi:hypothetical protein